MQRRDKKDLLSLGVSVDPVGLYIYYIMHILYIYILSTMVMYTIFQRQYSIILSSMQHISYCYDTNLCKASLEDPLGALPIHGGGAFSLLLPVAGLDPGANGLPGGDGRVDGWDLRPRHGAFAHADHPHLQRGARAYKRCCMVRIYIYKISKIGKKLLSRWC